MRGHLLLAACLFVVAGCGDPPKAPAQPKQTAAAYLADIESSAAAGTPSRAIGLATVLIRTYPESAEAAIAKARLPELEAALAVLAEKKRAEQAVIVEKQKAEQAAQQKAAESIGLAAKWSYLDSEDPMTSRKSRQATIESENTIELGFPYGEPQNATLVLRDHPSYGRNVIFKIERGQIPCPSWDGCDLKVRFDDEGAQTWHGSPPTSNESEIVFLGNYPKFIGRMRKAKIVRIQPTIYQGGAPVFEFHVAGFNFERYTGKGSVGKQ